MTEKINLDTFVDAVKDVLHERGPKFKYVPPLTADNDANACLYGVADKDGNITSSCLYGAVFIDKLGISYDPQWEQRSIYALIEENVEIPGDTATAYRIVDAFAFAQADQDNGEAYAHVEEVLDNKLYEAGYVRTDS